MSGTILARTWRPAIHVLLTGRHSPEFAGHVADLALATGRLVQVCSYCLTGAHRAALAGRPNVSHGVCRPCLKAELGKMGVAA